MITFLPFLDMFLLFLQLSQVGLMLFGCVFELGFLIPLLGHLQRAHIIYFMHGFISSV